MILEDVNFTVPQKKNFIKPASKSAFREKERKRRKKKKEQKKVADGADQINDVLNIKANDKAKDIASQNPYLEFFVNHVDSSKYYVKPVKVIKKDAVLLPEAPEEEEERTYNDFLNKAEFQAIKGTVDDLNIGEYIIQFLNPDDESIENRPVTMKEAEKVFESMLTIVSSQGLPKSVIMKQKAAFMLSFLQLKNYEPPENDDDDQQDLKKKAQPKPKKSAIMSAFSNIFSKKEEEEKKEEHHTEGNQIDYEFFEEQYLHKHKYDKSKYFEDLAQLNYQKELQNTKIEKAYVGGGFLTKRFAEDKSDWDWICNDTPPKDFLTLIRLTIMTKLARDAHMNVRSFLSTDGKYIFVVLKSTLPIVEKYAASVGAQKQFELGYADLFSLEPTDESNRPLRLKPYVRDPDYLESHKEQLEEIADRTKDKKDIERIESKAKKLFQQARKWDDHELRLNIVAKQMVVDKWMKKIAREMVIDQTHEKIELMDDAFVTKEVWESYYLYLEYVDDFMKRIEKVEKYQEIKNNKGFIYKLILMKSINDPNKLFWAYQNFLYQAWNRNDRKILKHIWDRMGIPPVAPFGEYFVSDIKDCIWRKYQINELGQRSEFLNMEKLKISHAIVLQYIDIVRLVQTQYVVDYFPIHDPFQLRGIKKTPLLIPIQDAQLTVPRVESEGDRRLNDLYVPLKDGAESTDFDVTCLADQASFHCFYPWSMPISTMRDYFGEKIALYFRFLQFFTQRLFHLSLLAIICQIVIDSATEMSRNAFLVIWAVIITLWCTFFTRAWKQQESIFQVQFGQQGFEKATAVRPAFEGKFMRSIVTDNLNEEYFPGWQFQLRMIFSFLVTLIILAMVIAVVISIFILKDYLVQVTDEEFVSNTIPSLIQSVAIMIFNWFYAIVADALNTFENHKYSNSYENSLIIKNFLFIFVNTFISLIIVAFLNELFPQLDMCKVNDDLSDCFAYLQSQMISIFLVNMAKNIPEMIAPCLKIYLKSEGRKQDDTPVIHEFLEIDIYLENQSLLEPYETNQEVDGTVADYMELIIQYSFLTMFGLSFPLSYLIAFLSNVAELQVDKIKLVYFSQRPLPNGAANIGNWFVIIELVNFLSICSNAGLIAFTSESVKTDQLQAFVIILVTLLGVKYLAGFLVPDEPRDVKVVKKRHENSVEKIFRSMVSSTKGYYPGVAKMKIECVDYSKMNKNQFEQGEHIIKGPNVHIVSARKE